MRNGVPCETGDCADSAKEVGTPSSVASKVRAQPLTMRARAARPPPARVAVLITNLLGKTGGARPKTGRRAPKLPRVTPPSFCESYARCRPSIPKPTFAPMTQPTLDCVLKPDGLFQRLLMDR